jgi:hypothetical protein
LEGRGAALARGKPMDTRHWNGPTVRDRAGNLDVKKEQTERDKIIGARARQRAIGRELRRMYDDVVQEPIPDDFLELLKKIDEADLQKGKKAK